MGKIFDLVKNNKGIFGVIAVLGTAFVAWLAFGFFGIQAAFIDDEASEEEIAANQDLLESFQAGSETETTVDADAGADGTEDGDIAETVVDPGAETDEDSDAVDTTVVDEDSEPTEPTQETETTQPPTTQAAAQPTSGSGSFSGTSAYDAAGSTQILTANGETRVFLLDDFVTDNGPDLKVYLRADNGDFISLGDLQNNVGSSNYAVPAGTDLSVFSTVEIWCERFGGRFGSAPISFT